MTGRELILYILENRLEDEPVFRNGSFIGYISDIKLAERLGVGVATVHTWALLGRINGAILIGDSIFIPVTRAMQMDAMQTEKQGSDSECKIN